MILYLPKVNHYWKNKTNDVFYIKSITDKITRGWLDSYPQDEKLTSGFYSYLINGWQRLNI